MIDDLSIDWIIGASGHRIIIEPSAHLSLRMRSWPLQVNGSA
jgi:hypothetical protein